MKKLLAGAGALLVALTLLLLPAGSAHAQPPPHDHFLEVPRTGASTQVGPPRCERGDVLDRAFEEFHFNVHEGEPGAGEPDLTIAAQLC